MSTSQIDRLAASFIPEPNSGCWLWTAHIDKGGYGKVTFNKKSGCLAHRVSWELHYGPIPEGMDILHKCDVRACVNPDHLFLGDDFINQRDRVAKGRHAGWTSNQIGEANLQAVLTTSDVLAIRAEYKGRSTPQHVIASRYGVRQSLISQIVNRKIWDTV